MDDNLIVPWRFIFKKNIARPRALITLWLVFHGRLATKDRLKRFGILQNNMSSLCSEVEETIDHLFFGCHVTMDIWKSVLNWLEVDHNPEIWSREKLWEVDSTKKKGWKARLLKTTLAESVHGIWLHRNIIIFQQDTIVNTKESIHENIVYRSWMSKRIRPRITAYMV